VRKGLTAAAMLGLSGVLAACGGGSSGSVSSKRSTKPGATTTVPAAPATVQTASTALGTILVAANGRTLYELDKDTATMSNCTGACSSLWPPLTVTGPPVAGAGIDATKLSVLMDANGMQVLYNGHPLYMFSQDMAPGDLKGQGFANNIWHVVAPSGEIITGAVPAATPSSSSSGSGSGSGHGMGGSGGY
jgi:predicted lipoprotein with Yx(FWY)xxD motif